MGEYDEEMKKSDKTIFKDFYSGVAKAIKEHNLTFSGWLQFLKKLSREEISDLFDNSKRHTKLLKEYEVWFDDKLKKKKWKKK